MADTAISILQWAIGMVVGDVVKRLQPKYPSVERFSPGAQLEREVSEALKAIQGIQSKLTDEEKQAMNRFVDTWGDRAFQSQDKDIKENIRAVKSVARSVYFLEKSGVEEVILYADGHDPVAVGARDFNIDPDKLLRQIVDFAITETVVAEVSATGREHAREKDSPDEVISEEDAARRCAYIISLVDVLQCKWVESICIPPDDSPAKRKRNLERLESNIRMPWWAKEDAKNMDQKLSFFSHIPMEKLVKALKCHQSRNDPPLRNVFVLGPHLTGQEETITSCLLTGRMGRNIASSHELAGVAGRSKHVAQEHEDFRIWDTPGFALEGIPARLYKQRLKENMMRSNGISAVIFQADQPRALRLSEVEMIEAVDYWFENRLSSNLMIGFQNIADQKAFQTQVQNCENELSQNVGAIGKENYIDFQVELTQCGEGVVLSAKKEEIERAKDIIRAKKVAMIRERAALLNGVLNSQCARDNEKREKLRTVLESYSKEETDNIRAWMDGAKSLRAIYENDQLLMFRGGHCCSSVLTQFGLGLLKRCKDYIILRGTCTETIKFLKKLSGLKSARGPQAQKWVEDICDQSYKFLLLTRDSDVSPRRRYFMYASYAALNKAGITRVKQMLGRERTLELLESIY